MRTHRHLLICQILASMWIPGCGSPGDEPAEETVGTSTMTSSEGSAAEATTLASDPESASSSGESETSGGSTTTDEGSTTTDSTGPDDVPEACGPLAGLPSEPAPHIAEIEALGENEWLALGAPMGDPAYPSDDPADQVARGRAWGAQAFVPAPELRGAFFDGEGVHAFVKPDGYGMDDYWFYDINANAWRVIHPGNHIESFNERVQTGGIAVDPSTAQLHDEDGNAFPLHLHGHAYDFSTWDSREERLAFIGRSGFSNYFQPGGEVIGPGLLDLQEQLRAVAESIELPAMSPWYYSAERCRFERESATWDGMPTNDGGFSAAYEPGANSTGVSWHDRPNVGGYPTFKYLSEIDQFFLFGEWGEAYFDPSTKTWTETPLNASDPESLAPKGIDHPSCYNAANNKVYAATAGRHAGLHVYDVATATWSLTSPSSMAPGAADTPNTRDASVMCDSVNGTVTVFNYPNRVIYAYDWANDLWLPTRELPTEVVDAVSYAQRMSFHDAELDAYFMFVAGDSNNNGQMFAYRY